MRLLSNTNRFPLVLGITFNLMAGILNIIVPLLVRSLIDSFYKKNSVSIYIWGIVLLFAMQIVLATAGGYLTSKFGEMSILEYRQRLFARLIHAKESFFDNTISGNLTSHIINDTNTIREFVSESLPTFINSIIIVIGSLGALLYLDYKLTAVLVVGVIAVFAMIAPLSQVLGNFSKQVQEITGNLSGIITSNFQKILLVKSNTAENAIQGKVKGLNERLYHKSLSSDFLNSLFQPLILVALFVAVSIIFIYGGIRVSNGTLTIGTLISFLIYLIQVLNPISDVGNFVSDYAKVKGSLATVSNLQKTPTEVDNNESFSNAKLDDFSVQFNDVHFKYDKRVILNGLNLYIPAGKKVALVGASGAGKSTIINLLERLYKPQHGNILISNRNIQDLSLVNLRRILSLVSQHTELVTGTIRDNLIFGQSKDISEDRLIRSLKNASIYDFIKSLPQGLDTYIGESGVKLSGGQKQRIQIARAILRDPKILILDEATANLDSESELAINKSVNYLINQGVTVLAISHRISTIKDANVIYFIKDGQANQSGTHDELIKRSAEYRRFVKEQMI